MESSASAGRVASAVLDPRRWWALALLCGAFFMVLLDGAITIVALPSIGAGLRFSEQGLQWVLSACALTFGGLLLLGRRAADLLGRRRVFMADAVFFTTASRLCGLAWSPAALLAARAVQGAGAAIMTPTALSIIFRSRALADRGSQRTSCQSRTRRPLPLPQGRGDQVRNEMSEQRTDSYHPRRPRRR
jgi:MFS family permease